MSRRNSRSNAATKSKPKRRNVHKVGFNSNFEPIRNYEDDFQYHSKTGKICTIDRPVHKSAINLSNMKELEPLTDTQEIFFESYRDSDAFILYGSAGTGKTAISLYHALEDILDVDSDFQKIIIVRSIVQTRDVGFLPGDEKEKLAPYEQPYIQLCADLFGRKDAYEKLKDMGKIEFHPTSFIRGTTFHDSIIIFDECQSATFHEISTVITRIGSNSKILLCGDSKQNDLIKTKQDCSGFDQLIAVSDRMHEFRKIRFTSDDIIRSGIVKSWIKACESLGL